MTRYKAEAHVWTTAKAQADIHFCSTDMLRTIVREKQCLSFVWPDEGDFNEHDDFVFNEQHRQGEKYPNGYQPLLIDIQTASILLQLRDRLAGRPIQKEGHPFQGVDQGEVFDIRIAEGRAWFGLFAEKAWSCAKFGVT